jgi:hypothetical protein
MLETKCFSTQCESGCAVRAYRMEGYGEVQPVLEKLVRYATNT